jgi:FKBP-type peptidyl-prolyl cis-trans isomerase (trigger factor)
MTENQELKSESEDIVVGDLSHPKETIIEPLSAPYRAVIWFEYDELKALFDDHWEKYGQAIIANTKVQARSNRKAREILEKSYGLAQLYGAVLQEIVYSNIDRDIMFLEGMKVYNYVPDSDDLHMVAVFYYVPELELKAEEELNWEVPALPMPPEEEERERRLKQLQQQYKTVQEAEEGAVIDEHSEVCMDLTASIEGKPYPLASFQGQWLEWKTLHYEELKDALLGHKVGDLFETEFEARYDADVNGKTVNAQVKIHGLRVITYPEIDDDLAKDDGYENLEDFNKRFHDDFEKYVSRAKQATVVDNLLHQILMKSTIPMFPDEWVKKNVEGMVAKHVSRFDGDKSKARKALQVSSNDDMSEKFKGQLYGEYLQQLAARAYCSWYDCGEPGSDEMFEHMLQNVEWVEEKEQA